MDITLNPLVSVVIPTKNSEKYLEITINSVLNQTYKNIELIIIDGCSSDKTIEIVKKYKSHISKFICEEDGGMYEAVNKGMFSAKGDIFCYINSDDLLDSNAIQKVVLNFNIQPSVDLIYGSIGYIDESGHVLSIKRYPKFDLHKFINSSYSMIGQPASFWRADLFKNLNGFDSSLKMASDFDFYIRAGMIGNIIRINEIMAHHRIHKESLTSTLGNLSNIEVQFIRKKFIKNNYYNKIIRLLNDIYFKIYNIDNICRFLVIKYFK